MTTNAGGAAAAAPGAADPAASGGTPPAAGGTPTPPAPPANWIDSVQNAEVRAWALNKAYKDPATALESHFQLERLHGTPKERLLKLPEKDDSPEWGEVYDRLGRPKEAKEYDIKAPEGLADDKFVDWAKSTFHEIGLPRKQAEKLNAKWNEYMSAATQAAQTAAAEKETAELASLRKEWGGAFEQNMAIFERAADSLGMSDDHLRGLKAAMGPAGAAKFVHGLGAKLGAGKEGEFVNGDGKNPRILTPAQARDQITLLRGDSDFTRRLSEGDAGAKSKWNELHKMGYPEE